VGRYHGPIDREDHLGWLPVNAIPVRGAEPGAWNGRINGLPGFCIGPGIKLAALEGAEGDPGRGIVVKAEANVLPRVIRKSGYKLQH
jgi:hypothetical protein